MAKIREESIRGQFNTVTFEIHYSAKNRLFVAKKLPEHLAILENYNNQMAASNEDLLIEKVKASLTEYEATQNNWQRYIIYKLAAHTNPKSNMQSWSNGRPKDYLGFDWQIVYFNQVGKQEFFISDTEWEIAKKYNRAPKSEHVRGDFNTQCKLLHTDELEAFFTSISDSLCALIKKVESALETPEKVLFIAASKTKLLQ